MQFWLIFAAIGSRSFPATNNPRSDGYTHVAWTASQGAPHLILAITQTKDGYLWIGSEQGLFRFDGRTFRHYQDQSQPHLPPGPVVSLLPVQDGGLWIGFYSGSVSLLRNGHAVNYGRRDGVPNGPIHCLVEDQDETIWAGSEAGLARLVNNRWHQVGADWNFPGSAVDALYAGRDGTLWVATKNTVVFLRPTTTRFQSTGIHISDVPQIRQASNGRLWMAETGRSVRPIPLHTGGVPSDHTEIPVGSQGFLFTRDGDLWIATIGDGLVRIRDPERLKGRVGKHSPVLEWFTTKDGLSDNVDVSLFEDRNGNVWMGSRMGLDRFRRTPLLSLRFPTELYNGDLVEGRDGNIMVMSPEGDLRIHDRHIDTVSRSWKPAGDVAGAYTDPTGTIWWVTDDAVVQNAEGRFTRYPLPKGVDTQSRHVEVTGGEGATLWIVFERGGLYSWKNGAWTRFDSLPELNHFVPTASFTDDRGRAWFGGDNGTVFYLEKHRTHIVERGRDSPAGQVRAIEGNSGHIWIGGTSGLTYFDGERLLPVVPRDARRFQTVSGIQELSNGSLWILEHRGLICIRPDDARRFMQKPAWRVPYSLFDSEDGLPGPVDDRVGHNAIHDTNGRPWFVTSNGVVTLNSYSKSLPESSVPTHPYIEAISADGQEYAPKNDLKLPAGIRNLQIRYASVSLTYPQRTRFRYKLGRVDRQWEDAGERRVAYYTNLRPGRYEFQVTPGNEEGAWSVETSVMYFNVSPFWYETVTFQVVWITAFALFIWALYRLRMSQVNRQFELTLETRLDERTRIARELHDTLLQSFHGLMFRFQAARNLMPKKPESAMQVLDEAIFATEKALGEGRDAIRGLRPESIAQRDLPELLNTAAQEMGRDSALPGFRLIVEGQPQKLAAAIQDEVYRIGREVIRNAFHHASASHVEVEVLYDEHQLRLRIRDDGRGIEPEALKAGIRPGHWGLPGMRERAKQIGARFELWSDAGAGTEVELRIPATIAYEKQRDGRRLRLFRWGGKRGGPS